MTGSRRLLGAFALTACSCIAAGPCCPTAGAAPAKAGIPAEVTIDSIWSAMRSGEKIHIYDANPPERYAKGHIPGAKWIHYDKVDTSDLPEDKQARLVFYCANQMCRASHGAAERALALGYRNVAVMPAGIMGWERAGKPTEAGGAAPPPIGEGPPCNLAAVETTGEKHVANVLAMLSNAKRRELPDGFTFEIANRGGLLSELGGLIENERRCCPFFSFVLRIPAGAAQIELSVTGPAHAKKLIAEILAKGG